MNYGLYLSAAGTLASLHRQDVLANNLANVETVGFKPDAVYTRARLPERLESSPGGADPQWMLENLGGGQTIDPTRIDFTQGALTDSHNDLDLAIQGEGFLVVSTNKGSPDGLRFTRDGRLTLNESGELTSAANGVRVLDVNDQPIRLSRGGNIKVAGDGTIVQNGATVARLQIASVADKSTLSKAGDNLMKFTGKRTPATGALRQRSVEASAVDPIMALNEMINASKAVQANATMMQYQDQILGQAVGTFGKVA
jgi:flagellar basal-body rod protein FlgF